MYSVVELCGKVISPRRSSRTPYMVGGLGFPFEVDGPSSRSVTDLGRSPSVITERIP
jgi:hypothetical protein